MGLLQCFRRFIKDFDQVATPLTILTRKGGGIELLDASCKKTFIHLKSILYSALIMQPPDWNRQFRCQVDTCNLAVGSNLVQVDKSGNEHAVRFFSKRLSPEEEEYTANDRELLGLLYLL